jgi:choline-sulfatase
MASKPNVLFLLSDQHNPHIAGFAGNRIVRTENLDRLAEQSVVFEHAYCQFPLCTPSRNSMWTGKLPARISAWGNYAPIPPEHLTMPEHFGEHGYVTCNVGKMHVGGARPMGGFQYRPYGDLVPNSFCGHQPDPPESALNYAWTSHKIAHFPFAGPSQIPESQLQDRIVTEETLAFIRDVGVQPWFVCASYSRPHHPWTAPARYFRRYFPTVGTELDPLPEGFPDKLHPHDKFIAEDFRLAEFTEEERKRGLAAYYASVDFLDDCIGDLLEGLAKDGLPANTIVIYTSDHGDLASEHGLWSKRSYYDGSTGVPLLIHAPGAMRDVRVGEVVELLDLFPTLCELCEIPIPGDLDGESLAPLLNGGRRIKDFARSDHIARMETTFRMIRTPEWKYVEFPEYPPVLFDMVGDPGEEQNVASENQSVVEELHARLWEDGESWESLSARKQADREAWSKEFTVRGDRTPNQYALSNGETVDAETMLYERYLREA